MAEITSEFLIFSTEIYNINVFFFQKDDITIRFWFLHPTPMIFEYHDHCSIWRNFKLEEWNFKNTVEPILPK